MRRDGKGQAQKRVDEPRGTGRPFVEQVGRVPVCQPLVSGAEAFCSLLGPYRNEASGKDKGQK